MIDFYCERLEPGLLSEPFNALTNIAFFVSAWAIWHLAKRLSALNAETYTLSFMTMAIGIGSMLFHSFASFWAWVLDVLPILVFQITFIWLYLSRVAHVRISVITVFIACFLLLIIALWRFSGVFNGSLPYFPAAITLVALGIYHFRRCTSDKTALLIAAGLFSIALIFRTIDLKVCDHFEIGTHFIWHLLTSVTLYICARAYILNRSS